MWIVVAFMAGAFVWWLATRTKSKEQTSVFQERAGAGHGGSFVETRRDADTSVSAAHVSPETFVHFPSMTATNAVLAHTGVANVLELRRDEGPRWLSRPLCDLHVQGRSSPADGPWESVGELSAQTEVAYQRYRQASGDFSAQHRDWLCATVTTALQRTWERPVMGEARLAALRESNASFKAATMSVIESSELDWKQLGELVSRLAPVVYEWPGYAELELEWPADIDSVVRFKSRTLDRIIEFTMAQAAGSAMRPDRVAEMAETFRGLQASSALVAMLNRGRHIRAGRTDPILTLS